MPFQCFWCGTISYQIGIFFKIDPRERQGSMFKGLIMTVALLAVSTGCGEATPAVQDEIVAETSDDTVVALGNLYCPVMGGEVSTGQHFDWEGFRIGICCPGCGGTFTADPQAYIPALLEDPGVSEEMKVRLSGYLNTVESQQ
jgi:putative hemolysin